MTQDLSRAYNNGDFIPDSTGFPPRWAQDAQAYRDELGARYQEVVYGDHPRLKLDLFQPEGTPKGLMVWIHGGYWKALDKSYWSHFARGAVERGWAVAMPSYVLAPEARLSEMTQQVATSITTASKLVAGPIVVSGHSAGGHLSARMACTDQNHDWTARLTRVVPMSPLADLHPIMQTDMNEVLHIDSAEAGVESPALLAKHAHVDCTVWVGAQERPVFLYQARLLSEEWNCSWHADPGTHHFDVIDAMRDADSPVTNALVG